MTSLIVPLTPPSASRATSVMATEWIASESVENKVIKQANPYLFTGSLAKKQRVQLYPAPLVDETLAQYESLNPTPLYAKCPFEENSDTARLVMFLLRETQEVLQEYKQYKEMTTKQGLALGKMRAIIC